MVGGVGSLGLPGTMTLVNPDEPYRSPLGPRATHGIRASYARGCRCRTEDGLFQPPQTTGCTEAWAAARRQPNRDIRARIRAERLESGEPMSPVARRLAEYERREREGDL